jgi:amino acid transporter
MTTVRPDAASPGAAPVSESEPTGPLDIGLHERAHRDGAVPLHIEAGIRDPWTYRFKNKLLGPPLHTEELQHERLGKPTALAVFASDNLSSVAYGTEEILRNLIRFVGVAAFSLVMPITIALLVVLAFLILSYRETIKAYPSAGGAYVVTKDNFGQKPALVAGVSLLTDYVLTVAVSVAAGTAALASAIHQLAPYAVPISLFFIWLIAFGNLRGVKESGKIFAVPTYFFIVTMVGMLIVGISRMYFGHLPVESLNKPGLVPIGKSGSGLFYGATLFIVLRAFASGGAAVTGVEAISNGVPAFREPAWKNARTTLVIMGTTLGTMFFGLSLLAAKVHAAPYESGTPTVISQIGKLVFGGSPVGHVAFYALQAGTMLILVLAANTSFADFPRLASFQASDNFLPRQLTKRGHRLVFSNGIVALAAAATALVVVTGAKVDHLIPLYAVGVFTSFTLSQAGMAKHHWRLREEGWRKGLVINAFGAFLSLVVDIIIGITKFKPPGAILGAWLIIVLVPIMVALLMRLNRQYEGERRELEQDAPAAAAAPIMRRHVVLVFLEQLDVSAARAIQYARTLTPDELRAVHIATDSRHASELADEWRQLGLSRLPLQLVDCPDRRLTRSALEVVAEALADGQTEVSVLLPRLRHERIWHRLLHDRTADSLSATISQLPHANVTFVPYHFGRGATPPAMSRETAAILEPFLGRKRDDSAAESTTAPGQTLTTSEPRADGTLPISAVRLRRRARVGGRVHSIRVQPWAGVPTLECTLVDDTGALSVVFLGRREVAGIDLGTRMIVEGMVGEHHGRLAILNPTYQLLPRA